MKIELKIGVIMKPAGSGIYHRLLGGYYEWAE